MTVEELIKKLEDFPKDAGVIYYPANVGEHDPKKVDAWIFYDERLHNIWIQEKVKK